jgi:hypothetical protein
MSPKIERTIVKLEDGDNFNKFVKHMHLKGYMTSEPPTVEKVLQKDDKGKYQEIDKTKWTKQVEKALETKGVEKPIDYKAEFEKQKAQNSDILARLEAMEKGKMGSTNISDAVKEVQHSIDGQNLRDKLEDKANELEITFRANIGDAKLLEKIQAVEPEFTV